MYQQPVKGRLPGAIRQAMPDGFVYLGDDQNNYYFAGPMHPDALGGFFDNLGNMFTRMVKITPKSFTPANIFKGVANGMLGVASMGTFYALPKNVKNSITKVASVAVPVVAAGVAAYTFGPSIMATIGPKLSAAGSLLGKAAGSIGGNLLSLMQKMPPAQQAAVAQSLTPEQIAAMEQSQQVPSDLVPMFQQAMANSLPPQASSGAASLYDPSAMAARELEQAKGMQDSGSDFGMLALLGVPLLLGVVLMTGKGR